MEISITCNTEDEILFKNVEHNSALPIPWVKCEPKHDGHAILVGGGPSLKDNLEEIRWRKSIGQTIFALNGAARFLRENDIEVDYTVIIDARPFNCRFIDYSDKYLISSQCDPSVFAAAGDKAILWQPVVEGIESHLPDHDDYALIGGGTTVGLSAMCLVYTLGYRKLHLFGYDSSHRETGHSYPQPENEHDPICKVSVYGKTFKCSWTMAKQAELFPTVCDNLIDLGCIITINGDGLIPHIVKHMKSENNVAIC